MQNALTLDLTHGSRRDQALRHRHLGEIALDPVIDDPHHALEHFTHATRLFHEAGDTIGHATAVIGQALAHLGLGRAGTALGLLDDIEYVLEAYGAPGYLGDLATARGRIHTRLGDHDTAAACYDAAVAHFTAAGSGAAAAVIAVQQARAAADPRR